MAALRNCNKPRGCCWLPYRLKQMPVRPNPVNLAEHRIRRKQVLDGLTHEYYIAG
jgi:hypothetical protein